MRCTTPHWQGNTFIDAGTLRPAGHPEVIPAFFEAYDVEEAAPAAAAEPEPAQAEEPKRGPGRPRKSDAA
jgi:hypothetical protein